MRRKTQKAVGVLYVGAMMLLLFGAMLGAVELGGGFW